MRYWLILLVCSHTLHVFSQSNYDKFEWDKNPAIHKIENKFQDAPAVYISDERYVEFILEKDQFFIYRTLHRVIHINNDKGIESFNKIYLPFNEGIELPEIKARTILPNGKVMELGKENIKDLKEEGREYKIFALEGLTRGCEVEYSYTIKKTPSFFGTEILSSQIPVERAQFELISPAHLIFETKSYNNLPIPKDEVKNGKRYLTLTGENIPEPEEEKYSMYQASLGRVEYKLSYNKNKNEKERLNTWDDLAKTFYGIFTNISEKDRNKIESLLTSMDIKGTTSVEKAIAIEQYMKKNFITREDIPKDDATDLGSVIKNKVASYKALYMLYVNLFNTAHVSFEMALSGDRTDYIIDRNFENWNNPKHFLFYFPDTHKFMAPTEQGYRYPWIPPSWAATNALFCESTTIGNFSTAMASIKYVDLEPTEKTFINLDIKARMEKEDTLLVDIKQSLGGYAAPNFREAFEFMSTEQQDKLLKKLVKDNTNSEFIVSHSYENKELDESDPYLPFVLNISVKTTNLIEQAGDKLLFKIGSLIGEQSEMYGDKDRTTDIQLEYPHSLNRSIEFIIPKGYTISNINDLVINQVCKENDMEKFGFMSGYEQIGNMVRVTIKEDYPETFYSKELFEKFKKVINASADFNKVVLILKKG